MSGVCGIVNFDGAPVDAELLKKMAETAAYRGPDGIRYWIEGNVGFAHLAMHTTPESVHEVQPLANDRRDLVLVADARVDNRDELIRTLTIEGVICKPQPTDADLILAAYECWGEACPQKIVGDYAFAIWDARRSVLFCARDALGVRPFHYHRRGPTLLFGSSVASLVAFSPSSMAVNATLLQDMIVGRFDRWIDETAYRTILRLPQGYSSTVDEDGISLTRYWTLGAQAQPRYRHDQEYVDHFRELFEQSIRARLRSHGPVGIAVSGGLDSSSIACVIQGWLRSGPMPNPVHLYSYVFYETPRADEREYLQSVLDTCQDMESTQLPGDDCWGLKEFADDGGYPLDEPELSVDRALLFRLMRRMSRDGCRVGLWGTYADQLLTGGPYPRFPILKDISLRHLADELGYFRRFSQRPAWWLLAYRLLPSWGLTQMRRILSRNGLRRTEEQPAISRGVSGIPAPDLLSPPGLRSISAQVAYASLAGGPTPARQVARDKAAAHLGIEQRFPFLDRRLVDYTLALPPRLCFGAGFEKLLLRRAMEGILPEDVRWRTRRAVIGELIERGLHDQEVGRVHDLLTDARVVQSGLVDGEALSYAWREYWNDANSYPARPLIRALCVEAWLRHQEERNH